MCDLSEPFNPPARNPLEKDLVKDEVMFDLSEGVTMMEMMRMMRMMKVCLFLV